MPKPTLYTSQTNTFSAGQPLITPNLHNMYRNTQHNKICCLCLQEQKQVTLLP